MKIVKKQVSCYVNNQACTQWYKFQLAVVSICAASTVVAGLNSTLFVGL